MTFIIAAAVITDFAIIFYIANKVSYA